MRAPGWIASGVLSLLLVSPALADELSAVLSVDRSELAVDEQLGVVVKFTTNGSDFREVKLPRFEGFEVLAREERRPMEIRFGFGNKSVFRAQIEYRFTLRARKAGTFEFGPAQVSAGARTAASNRVRVVVRAAVAGGAGAASGAATDATLGNGATVAGKGVALDRFRPDEGAFFRVVADKRDPYVGEQVTVTVYLYSRLPLRSSVVVSREASTTGFWLYPLLPPTGGPEPTRQQVNGVPYDVHVLRRFAAFALKPGALTIGALAAEFEAAAGFDLFGSLVGGGVVKRESLPLEFNVRALPPGGAGQVEVGAFTLEVALDRDRVPTGDAVTLTATVRGVGDVRGIRLELPRIDGVEVLPPQVRDQVEAPQDVVGGSKTFEWILVPQRPGTFTVPALSFQQFDPTSGRYSTVKGSALSISAVGSAQGVRTPGDDHAASAGAPEDSEDGFGEVRRQAALLRGEPAGWTQAWWFAWAVLMGPMVLAAWLLVLTLGAWRGRPRRTRAGRADALAQLAKRRDDRDASALAVALAEGVRDSLQAQLGAPARGATLSELGTMLRARGLDDDGAVALVQALAWGEQARFGGLAAERSDVDSLVEACRGALGRLERGGRMAA